MCKLLGQLTLYASLAIIKLCFCWHEYCVLLKLNSFLYGWNYYSVRARHICVGKLCKTPCMLDTTFAWSKNCVLRSRPQFVNIQIVYTVYNVVCWKAFMFDNQVWAKQNSQFRLKIIFSFSQKRLKCCLFNEIANWHGIDCYFLEKSTPLRPE